MVSEGRKNKDLEYCHEPRRGYQNKIIRYEEKKQTKEKRELFSFLETIDSLFLEFFIMQGLESTVPVQKNQYKNFLIDGSKTESARQSFESMEVNK